MYVLLLSPAGVHCAFRCSFAHWEWLQINWVNLQKPSMKGDPFWGNNILWSGALWSYDLALTAILSILKKLWNYEDQVCCLQDRPYISRAGLLFAMIGCCQPCSIKVKDLTETCPYKETQRGIFQTKFQDYELTFVMYPTLCRNMSVIFIYEGFA